jgi:hypothetical protein
MLGTVQPPSQPEFDADHAGAALPERARPQRPPSTAARLAVAAFCTAMLAATLAAVRENWKDKPEDGFPFSYYPMFSRRLGETYRVTHVVGVDGDGREHVIPYGYLGTGALNEVRQHVRRAARRSPDEFCAQVAAELGAEPDADGDLRGVREIVIRTGAYVLKSFYAGRIEARSEREHARCRVPR